ncbi:hypothetical protein ACFYYB_26695 [Streptomyces sp. NPDC002886]|uniref:hypothetical protein n=1 Tax=Streptomyces sp. NPDC002886 TaxID=3364667 RepID=UPI0036A7C83B
MGRAARAFDGIIPGHAYGPNDVLGRIVGADFDADEAALHGAGLIKRRGGGPAKWGLHHRDS